MSMIGEYARLTPAELDRAIRDPEWAREFVVGLIEREPDTGPAASEARCHDIDKTWHALDFLLRRIDFPVGIAHGEKEVPGAEGWGHEPPRYLTPERVRLAAETLADAPHEALVEGVRPAELAEAEIYPAVVWERGEPLDYVTSHYQALVPFFRAAADAGDAMLIRLD
ncbi:YfbM family protein [Streptomyces sp. NPDC001732]